MGRSNAASGMILDEYRGSQGTDLPSPRARSLGGGRPAGSLRWGTAPLLPSGSRRSGAEKQR